METTKTKNMLVGLVVGLANGMLGAGGGSLLVPALQKIMKMETHKSHATALAIMLPLSIVSALVYTWGVDVDWMRVLLVCAGGLVGGVIGARLLNRISAGWLNILFGLFLTVGAVRMLFA